MTDAQAAWLAALVDGEGCVGIWRERRPKNRSGFRYYAALEVVNTCRALIDAVSALLGGNTWVKDGRLKPKHKVVYVARIRRSVVGEVLRRIVPFLIVKPRQAEKVLEFCEILESAPMRASLVHDDLQRLYEQCKALNKRGTK